MSSAPSQASSVRLVPVWDAECRRLSFDGRLVKWFRQPADNQVRILSAFQELDWPRRIDDPLPGEHGVDPRQRLREAIKSLNGCQEGGQVLRFRGDGTGEGVTWEIVEVG
jgi:hypothetical protein